jgi:hypothetical protein
MSLFELLRKKLSFCAHREHLTFEAVLSHPDDGEYRTKRNSSPSSHPDETELLQFLAGDDGEYFA